MISLGNSREDKEELKSFISEYWHTRTVLGIEQVKYRKNDESFSRTLTLCIFLSLVTIARGPSLSYQI